MKINGARVSIKYFIGLLMLGVFAAGFALSVTSCKGPDKSEDSLEVDETTGIESIDKLAKVILAGTDDAEVYFDRSVAYAEVEAYDNAIVDMYDAMKLDSLQPRYYVHLTDVFMSYYRSKQALQTLRLATERFPQNLDILLKYAELSLTLMQNQQAVQTLNKILEQDNQNAQAYFLMGLLMQSEGDFKRAKAAFKKVVEIDPEVVDAYLLLGELYEEDDPALAEQYLKNAMTVAPDEINSLHSMAFFQQNHDNVPGALELYRQINVLQPSYSPAFLNAGILYIEIGELEAALEQFEILVGLEPGNHLGYFYRGLTYKLMGKKEQAITDFENALRFKEDYKKARLELLDLQNKE